MWRAVVLRIIAIWKMACVLNIHGPKANVRMAVPQLGLPVTVWLLMG